MSAREISVKINVDTSAVDHAFEMIQTNLVLREALEFLRDEQVPAVWRDEVRNAIAATVRQAKRAVLREQVQEIATVEVGG